MRTAFLNQVCPNRKYNLAADRETARVMSPDAFFTDTLAPLILESDRLNREIDVIWMKEALVWLKASPKIENKNILRAFNTILLASFVGLPTRVDSSGETKVALGPARKKLKNIPLDLFRWVVKGVNIFWARQEMVFPYEDISSLRMLYPGKEWESKIKETETKIDDLQRIVEDSDTFRVFKQDFLKATNKKRITRLLSQNNVSPSDLADVNTDWIMLQFLVSTIKQPEWRAYLERPVDIKAFDKMFQISQHLSKSLAKPKLRPPDQALHQCLLAYNLSQALLPIDDQISDFKSNKEKILRSQFKAGVKKFISEESWKFLEPRINEWGVNYPYSKEGFSKNMEAALKGNAEKDSHSLEVAKGIHVSAQREARLAFYISQLPGAAAVDDDASSSDVTCADFFLNPVPDMALNGNFSIGPLTLRYQDYEISFHEMSHLLAGEITDAHDKDQMSTKTEKWFERTSTCIGKIHNADSSAVLVSEDWADWLAAKVSGKHHQPFNCAFLQTPNNQIKPDKKEWTLTNPVTGDMHSSTFFRILYGNYLKNEDVPQLCERAIAEKDEKAWFMDCADDSPRQPASRRSKKKRTSSSIPSHTFVRSIHSNIGKWYK
jgi:hypothetical protein